MDFTGRYVIAAPPQKVWDAIYDPEVLKACIPGCEALERTSASEFVATARIKIGPVSATFRGKIALSDMNEPHSVKLTGEGQGGVAGFARGGADVTLTPEGHSTVLTYIAKATVGGKLAQIGQRLVDGAARQIADDFFKRFSAVVAPPPAAPDLSPDPTTEEVMAASAPLAAAGVTGEPHATAEIVAAAPGAPMARTGLSPFVWVAGLIAVIAVLLFAFARS
ncbi:MAG: carbon monoxide dehydrogenase subunit G [Alphaproteobacteria bacterium]|nr:carbon monoxide dehydrogenase subunit G [Alphaproteobacteria bacterium]MBL6936546.1 carbon monoxide dehydrogenase subunit G [Alphaproteobacteria bacterium]MBL7098403.1 carbon monoxide dehydrogenase subunit G [Alphaproteobacteria bacterium]